jgi:hypothetical protein
MNHEDTKSTKKEEGIGKREEGRRKMNHEEGRGKYSCDSLAERVTGLSTKLKICS